MIQDGAENADVRRNKLAEKDTLVYHRCANWVPQESQNYWDDWDELDEKGDWDNRDDY